MIPPIRGISGESSPYLQKGFKMARPTSAYDSMPVDEPTGPDTYNRIIQIKTNPNLEILDVGNGKFEFAIKVQAPRRELMDAMQTIESSMIEQYGTTGGRQMMDAMESTMDSLMLQKVIGDAIQR